MPDRPPDIVPMALDDRQLDAIAALAWRPAWRIRNRVGCLAPLVTWWRDRCARMPIKPKKDQSQ